MYQQEVVNWVPYNSTYDIKVLGKKPVKIPAPGECFKLTN